LEKTPITSRASRKVKEAVERHQKTLEKERRALGDTEFENLMQKRIVSYAVDKYFDI
jgi:hypothetical protein